MDELVTWLVWSFFGGLVLGVLIDGARERVFWRRLTITTYTQHPISTTMPTMTGLRTPDWMQDEDRP